jgi:oxygen-independent coproporphyrinogen-3 oxidase
MPPTVDPRAAVDLGVYVHVPFCRIVCPYCDFAVERTPTLGSALERGYVDRLLDELDVACEAFALAGRPLATLYFGGGTPSLLAPDTVAEVITRVGERFPGPASEVTLELNPGLAERPDPAALRRAGVTRLSVGLQAFDDVVLRRLGRAHSARDAREGLDACLAGGFPSLSVDLIYGAPGQTEASVLADVEALVALGVPHVSAYALTLEPGTPFHDAARQGKLRAPGDLAVRRMGRRLRAHLAAAGLVQYEISSYARPGHASRHNARYWLRQDVLGLGVSAASLVDEIRWQSPRSRPAWERRVTERASPRDEAELLAPRERQREALALGLRRLEGVSRAAYARRYGALPERRFPHELDELLALELVETTGDHLRLTERGILFADEVFLRFTGR